MGKSNKAQVGIGFGKILLTAVITAIATTVSQGYLSSEKHKEEMEFWRQKYNIAAIDDINDRRFQLLEEINQELLQLEVKAKEIKLVAAMLENFPNKEDAQKLTGLMVQYHKDLFLTSSKSQMAALIFDQEVDSLLPILGDALEKNFNNNLRLNNNQPLLAGSDMDFETINQLTNTRLSIIEAMYRNIEEAYRYKVLRN